MGAIISGLKNSFIQSLKAEWKRLDDRSIKLFERMEEILGAQNNFSCYRKLLEEVAQKEAPFIPYLAIHLRDIASMQEIFEKSEKIYQNIIQVIDNGKKIWSVLRAQKLPYQLEKDEEMFNYLINAKYLSSDQIFNLYKSNTIVDDPPGEEKKKDPKILKRSNSFQFLDNMLIIEKNSGSGSGEVSPKSGRREFLLELFQKRHSERSHLYKMKEKEFSKREEFSSSENIVLLDLWKDLKSLFISGEFELHTKLKKVKKNYFSSKESIVIKFFCLFFFLMRCLFFIFYFYFIFNLLSSYFK